MTSPRGVALREKRGQKTDNVNIVVGRGLYLLNYLINETLAYAFSLMFSLDHNDVNIPRVQFSLTEMGDSQYQLRQIHIRRISTYRRPETFVHERRKFGQILDDCSQNWTPLTIYVRDIPWSYSIPSLQEIGLP